MKKMTMAVTLTAVPKDKQASFNWDAFDHATHSPDLTSSNFQAFPGLHNSLREQQFHDEESLKKVVTNFFEKDQVCIL